MVNILMNMKETAAGNYAGVWGNHVGFDKKAALVVIDFVKAFTLPDAPLYAPGVVEAVKQSIEVQRVKVRCSSSILWAATTQAASWTAAHGLARHRF